MDQIIVIGSGPAGLMATITASMKGKKVILLERNEKVSKKLAISGSGQCNLTHDGDIMEFCEHYGKKKKEAYRILRKFSNLQLIDFFHRFQLRLDMRDDGKCFPLSRRSEDIINFLLARLKENAVDIIRNSYVINIVKRGELFRVITKNGEYITKSLICATGGHTFVHTGSDGSFFKIARQLGHTIIPLGKGLSPVYTEKHSLKELSGMSFKDAGLIYKDKNGLIQKKRGELLITHKGFSGPLIIDNSRDFFEGMSLLINFTSFLISEEMENRIIEMASITGRKTLTSFLSELGMPKRLIEKLLLLSGINKGTFLSQLNRNDRALIRDCFTAYPVKVKALGGINESMVTTGGIDLKEIKLSTMESKLVNNLYFCGEMLDIDGDSGGYNIQMAFSTGYIAGFNA